MNLAMSYRHSAIRTLILPLPGVTDLYMRTGENVKIRVLKEGGK